MFAIEERGEQKIKCPSFKIHYKAETLVVLRDKQDCISKDAVLIVQLVFLKIELSKFCATYKLRRRLLMAERERDGISVLDNDEQSISAIGRERMEIRIWSRFKKQGRRCHLVAIRAVPGGFWRLRMTDKDFIWKWEVFYCRVTQHKSLSVNTGVCNVVSLRAQICDNCLNFGC